MPKQSRIQLPDLIDAVERAIKAVRERNDKRAEDALRHVNVTIVRNYHASWLSTAEELVSSAMKLAIKEGKDVQKCTEFLARMEATRFNTDAFRQLMLEFMTTCSAFNTCYVARGFAVMLEYFRTNEPTEVDEKVKHLQKIAVRL